MGSYVATAGKLVFKKATPAALIAFLRETTVPWTELLDKPVPEESPDLGIPVKVQNDFRYICSCGSAYHKSYEHRGMRETDVGYEYRLYSSSKYGDSEMQLEIARAFQPWLVLDEGLIVFRSVYEDSLTESVVYYQAEHGFKKAKGYLYSGQNGCLTDYNHPWLHSQGDISDAFDPEACLLPDHLKDTLQKVEDEKEDRDGRYAMSNVMGYIPRSERKK